MTWPEPVATRPLWLVTLADLALLLVGFLVLLHAARDPKAVARALQSGFAAETPATPPAIPVAAERVGFAAGEATAAVPPGLRAWATEQLRDPRVELTVIGSVDGSAADVDRATRSPALLAADRARGVAALLAPLAPMRVRIATGTGARAVTVTLAFAGERKVP